MCFFDVRQYLSSQTVQRLAQKAACLMQLDCLPRDLSIRVARMQVLSKNLR